MTLISNTEDSSCGPLNYCPSICNLPIVVCLVAGFVTLSIAGEIVHCLFGNDSPCD